MNWGKGLVIGMLLFIAFIVSMSCYMFNLPADDYDHQYYEKGLNFNRDYDREHRVTTDKEQPLISQTNSDVTINFKHPAVGTIVFLNPLGRNKDVVFPLNTNKEVGAIIPLHKLSTGQWTIRLEWNSEGKEYLYQQSIYINGQ